MSKVIPYRQHLILPADPRLSMLIPHAKKLVHEGQEVILVPHKVDETAVLRNLGYDVPPPMLANYNWPGPPPFDAQRITAALIAANKRCFVLNGLGTGKTRSLLFAYDYLKQTGYQGRLLVTCPLSTLRQTWEREVAMIFPHLSTSVLYGRTKAKRLKALDVPADIYVINHDGVEVLFKELMERIDITWLCLDELSVYKNASTDLWKHANLLGSRCDRLTGLTATPMPTAPTDAFGQIKMIAPQNLKGMHFGRFKEQTMQKVSTFVWVRRRDSTEYVHKLMQPGVRFTRDECYDLPPCQIVTRVAPLSKEQEGVYAKVAGEMAAQIAQGDVKAVNEADRINKLLQISLGTVYDTERNTIELDCAPRLKVMDEAIEGSDSKVIIFTPYRNSLNKLVQHVSKRWATEKIDGDTSPTQREKIFTRFMHSADPHCIVAHPATMSHGLTLTAASTIVWYGPPLSLEMYEQANGRITRAGQRHAQLILNIAATRLEQKIYTRLEQRAATQGLLLDLFENQEIGALL